MQLRPVIARELRVQARNRATFWLRVAVAGAAALALAAVVMNQRAPMIIGRTRLGPWVFASLHTAICVVLAVSCPFLTADALARERREGTLGILLLTPLDATGVVLGKMCVHFLRAFTMWLANLPVLVVPLLLGGVAPTDIGFALALELGVILGGLAGGILASSAADDAGRAAALAVVLTALIGEGLALLSFVGFYPFLRAHAGSEYGRMLLLTATLGPWLLGTGLLENGFSGLLASSAPWLRAGLVTSLSVVTAGSLVAWLMAYWHAVRRVRRLAHKRSLTPVQQARRQFWSQPRLANRRRGRLQQRMRRNPMLWLYTRGPHAGLRRWGWCAVAVLVWLCIYAIGFEQRGLAGWVFGLPLGLVTALALAAAMGFRHEMEGGFLEVLLATPVSPASIVWARVLTLWRDFFPALVLSTGMAVFWMAQNEMGHGGGMALAVAWSSFVAAPLVGSRLAVRRISPLLGWAWTLAVCGAVPALFAALLASIMEGPAERPLSFGECFIGGFIVLQLSEGILSGWCAVMDLDTRRFQLKPLRRTPR